MAAPRDIAGRRYALAVADLAREHGDAEQWHNAIDGLDVLTSTPAYVDALQSERSDDDRLQTVVREIVPGIGALQLNLFRLLRQKARLALGPSIASYYRELRDEQRGVVRAEVRTAVELSDERRQAISDRLQQWTGQTVEVEAAVDPALLGGAEIRVGDRLIDGSTRGRLRGLREQLVRSAAEDGAAEEQA
ncbi:MAG: ATP synthase F1 subunit delta [Dehalococcoidia bacterium]|jgi:F-type H+-transporting ATPase subunit delta|nr:ATP synthase F1 subunit delta [Dehalococcoidia bacterium]